MLVKWGGFPAWPGKFRSMLWWSGEPIFTGTPFLSRSMPELMDGMFLWVVTTVPWISNR